MRLFLSALQQENERRMEERRRMALLPEPCMVSFLTFRDYSDPNHVLDAEIAKMKAELRKADPSEVQAAWNIALAWLVMES
jgi:hypothetical protein